MVPSTALRFLNGAGGSRGGPRLKRDPYIETFVNRLSDWREIRKQTGGYGARITIDQASSVFAETDRGVILKWLRAGMPFAQEGDWETGDGFVLVSHWVLDWTVGLLRQCDFCSEPESAGELGLDGIARSARRAA